MIQVYGTKLEDQAYVENFAVGGTQVLQTPGAASWIIDLSQIKFPKNTIFGFPMIYNPDGLAIRQATIMGTDKLTRSTVEVSMEFYSDSPAS